MASKYGFQTRSLMNARLDLFNQDETTAHQSERPKIIQTSLEPADKSEYETKRESRFDLIDVSNQRSCQAMKSMQRLTPTSLSSTPPTPSAQLYGPPHRHSQFVPQPGPGRPVAIR